MCAYRSGLNRFPNEIFYFIFDYLSSNEIIESFVGLNQHFNDLIQCYIKQLDLNQDQTCDRDKFKWIGQRIERLRINRYHLYLFDKSIRPSSLPSKKRKFLPRSIVNKIFRRDEYQLEPVEMIYSEKDMFIEYLKIFSRLKSIELIDIKDNLKLISNTNIEHVCVTFKNIHEESVDLSIVPRSIRRLSTNVKITNCVSHFNETLVDLTLTFDSIGDLTHILQYLPNLERLSINYKKSLYSNRQFDFNHRTNSSSSNSNRLTKLNRLSIATESHPCVRPEEYLRYDRLLDFIDENCPDETILKRISLKFYSILFDEHFWHRIQQYKMKYQRFDFYGTFLVEKQSVHDRQMIICDDRFAYHIEDHVRIYVGNDLIHIYSLPFTFNELSGFQKSSLLNKRCSYLTVHELSFASHLAIDEIRLKSLLKRMPYLVSIRLIFNSNNCHSDLSSQITFDNYKLESIRSFDVVLNCITRSHQCYSRHLVTEFIQRMPSLQILTSSTDDFLHRTKICPMIKQFHVSSVQLSTLRLLPILMPNLSILSFDLMAKVDYSLSELVPFLFMQLKNLHRIWIQCYGQILDPRSPRKAEIREALQILQEKNIGRFHLIVDYIWGFSLFRL